MSDIEEASLKDKSDPKYELSSNALFHFTRKLEFLLEVIKNGYFSSRYVKEDVEYLNLMFDSRKASRVALPMLCFCDIKLHELKHHVNKYGKFGIGISKEWAIKNNIDPIHYRNPKSKNTTLYSGALNKAIENNEDNIFGDELITQLAFSKPLFGKMNDMDGKITNFHDEQEWRYVPNFDDSDNDNLLSFIDDVNDSNLMNEFSLGKLSNSLKEYRQSCLEIDWNEVRYIFVKSSNDSKVVIQAIIDKNDLSMDQKLMMISKVVIVNELEEDW